MLETAKNLPSLAGLIVVDKPLGWSSMAVVRVVRRAAGGVKTGHAGTLDPLATGVLVCCIGAATKQVPLLMGMTKVYEAEVDLLAFTETDDREAPAPGTPGTPGTPGISPGTHAPGSAREEAISDERRANREEQKVRNQHFPAPPPAPGTPAPGSVPGSQHPTLEELRVALGEFAGEIQQIPPAYSAIKVGGRRAYKMARAGMDVKLTSRMVRIDCIELLNYAWPIARLRITCGKGTYIRSLARDLGKRMGTGGHLASLRRLAIGPYDISGAVQVERFKQPVTQADLLPPPPEFPPPEVGKGEGQVMNMNIASGIRPSPQPSSQGERELSL